MARVRTAKHPKPAPAEPEQPNSGQETQGKAASKAEIVREAVGQGIEAPGDIVEFAHARYGVELTKQMASSYKAQAKARAAKNGGQPRRRGSVQPVYPRSNIPPEYLEDLEALRRLIDGFGGPDNLKRFIDVLEPPKS